jgi:hypothetical protein
MRGLLLPSGLGTARQLSASLGGKLTGAKLRAAPDGSLGLSRETEVTM